MDRKAIRVHGTIYDYSAVKYKTASKKVTIICKTHGEFQQMPSSHISLKQGCPNCTSRISKIQIHWLEFMSKMNGVTIQHGMNKGEFRIPKTRYFADGYCQETNTIYEFHGDYWHGNPSKYKANNTSYYGKTFGELYEKTLKKENKIRSLNYNLVTIWESEWLLLNQRVKMLQKKYRERISQNDKTIVLCEECNQTVRQPSREKICV